MEVRPGLVADLGSSIRGVRVRCAPHGPSHQLRGLLDRRPVGLPGITGRLHVARNPTAMVPTQPGIGRAWSVMEILAFVARGRVWIASPSQTTHTETHRPT